MIPFGDQLRCFVAAALSAAGIKRHFARGFVMRSGFQFAIASLVLSVVTLSGACSPRLSEPVTVEELEIVSEDVADVSPQLQELRKRRVEELAEACTILQRQYESGVIPLEQLLSARAQLAEAEVEAAETPQARVAVLEKLLALSKEHVQVVQGRVDSGNTSTVDLLLAKAALTSIEIKLLQAKEELESP
ncbi:hypothetical protein C5Y93_25875 [Blastopirellula marina]|uniref:Uncharacterized protein n=2 Tax=Blastopirellula marina TaxID=124 RepID=A0A2S8GF95_9BACT|nr:hypothetical protein C5Y93_25875 [Blastopirellula marina]